MKKPRWSLILIGGLLSLTVGCQGFGLASGLPQEIRAQPLLVQEDDFEVALVRPEECECYGPLTMQFREGDMMLRGEEAATKLGGKFLAHCEDYVMGRRFPPPSLLRELPLGMPIEQAVDLMRQKGFACEHHGGWRGVLCWHCRARDYTPSPTNPRSWWELGGYEVHLEEEEGRLKDIRAYEWRSTVPEIISACFGPTCLP
jgi:hypothetical protein